VLKWQTTEQRGYILGRLIDIAHACCKLQNYETVVQIVSGLEKASISRLKQSWLKVSQKSCARLEKLRAIFSPMENWKTYRTQLSTVEPPAIPYLGLILQSLIFTEDGNPNRIPPHQLINWYKHVLLGQILEQIRRFQGFNYPITVVNPIVDLFKLDNFTPRSDKQLFEESLLLEPRITEEELKALKLEEQRKQQLEKNVKPENRTQRQQKQKERHTEKQIHRIASGQELSRIDKKPPKEKRKILQENCSSIPGNESIPQNDKNSPNSDLPLSTSFPTKNKKRKKKKNQLLIIFQ